MSKPRRRSFEVIGLAPPGFGCAMCYRGGPELKILHGRHVSLWHRACAQEYFRTTALEPTKPKVAAVLERK